MISKASKFPMRTHFLRFRAQAKRIVTLHFSIFYSSTASPSHLSVVVPAKVNKLATTRNWLKRLTYDALWPTVKDKNVDCVVVYKPLPLTRSSQFKELIASELKDFRV